MLSECFVKDFTLIIADSVALAVQFFEAMLFFNTQICTLLQKFCIRWHIKFIIGLFFLLKKAFRTLRLLLLKHVLTNLLACM